MESLMWLAMLVNLNGAAPPFSFSTMTPDEELALVRWWCLWIGVAFALLYVADNWRMRP